MYTNINRLQYDQLSNWADYIIVGAGASGCVVAARLAENPNNNILIIELGPNNYGNKWIETPSSAKLLWDHPDGPRPSPTCLAFETSVQMERKYRYPRGNGLGGSINHHSLIDGRGSKKIYDNIAKLIEDNRWSYDNILPYYKKMEKASDESYDPIYHGKSGWLNIRKATIKSPFYDAFVKSATKITQAPFQTDMSGHPKNVSGIGISDVQIKDNGKRSSSYEDLLIPIMEKNKNVVILFNTLVTNIIFDKSLKAIGIKTINQPHVYNVDRSNNVEYRKPEYYNFFCQKEIILSGGAINTPQILMLSGIGPRWHLEKYGIDVLVDSPGVGTNLMDHHEISITFEIDPDKMVWPAQAATLIDTIDEIDDINLSNLRNYLTQYADKKEQKEGSGGMVIDWFSGIKSDIGHDLHIHVSEGFMFDFDLSSNEQLPDGRLRSDYFLDQRDPYNFRVFQHFLIENLRPTITKGVIRLCSADPRASPVIDLSLDKDELACERMALGVKMVRKIVDSQPLKNFYKILNDKPLEIFPGPDFETIEDLKYYMRRWSSFGHHISGTAKMGTKNDEYAVVDSNLRVYGVTNLRVIDTSIYPTPYFHGYNTSRGAYLIGELGADFIKGVL
jgi:choline dehydrogenase-like flavoprotein